jgi:amino acid transporter
MESDAMVFGAAGNGAWLAYLLSMLGLWLVGLNINQFAKRCASSGSLYTYIGRGLGAECGLLGAWCLLLAYLCTGMATLLGAGTYFGQILRWVGVSNSYPFMVIAIAALVWWALWKDVQLSVRCMLWIEASSILCLSLVAAFLLLKKGAWFDGEQLALSRVDFRGLRLGMILAIFSYVGYESAACLGEESRRPLRSIPGAILWSVLLSGLFFTWIAYAKLSGLRALGQAWRCGEVTVADLAQEAGLGALQPLLYFLAGLSFFACTVASLTAASRLLLTLGRQEILPGIMGQVHPENHTPHVAGSLCALASLVFPLSLLREMKPEEAYDVLGTVATYGFLATYGLVSLAAPLYLFRLGELKMRHCCMAFASLAFLVLPFGASLSILQNSAIHRVPYLFWGYVVCGLAWIGLLKLWGSQRLEALEEGIAWDFGGSGEKENG